MPSKNCFFVMPFRSELNFFYLFLRKHLQEKHDLHVERGDHKILTIPLLEKIKRQIQEADVIVGDITGRNPNVFYELGIADTLSKPVILITQNDASDVPTDIKHLEFIKYDLSNHEEVISNIDNAIHHVFEDRYSELYTKAEELLSAFLNETGLNYPASSSEEFQARIVQAERTHQMPADTDEYEVAAFLLPKIVADTSNIAVMKSIMNWLNEKYS